MSHRWMTHGRSARDTFGGSAPVLLLVLGWIFGIANTALAQTSNLVDELSTARRVYVPSEELDVVVDSDHRGAILPAKKFQELLDLAKANALNQPGIPIVLTSSDYQARVTGDQLLLTVTAEITQFVGDWQQLTFPMQRVAIEKATLDGEAAMVGRGADGSVTFLSEKRGKHTLNLELSTELTSQGSDQVAAFSLLRAPSGSLSLTLPAGKRLLVGALQLERPTPLDQAADYKISIGGAPGMQLRVTDRAADNSADALIFATTGYGLHVAPGEVTWHALTTLQVFGTPVDKLTFSVPNTLEIADVEATGLEAWELSDDPADKKRTKISVTFSQAFDGSRKISLKGVMATEAGKPWTVPALTIEKITSHVGQVIVQHPAGVRLRIEETSGVRRATQGQKPTADMPDDISKMNATEYLRFDVWQPDFVLRLTTQPKEREVQTAIAAVMDVNATGLDLQALLTVETHFAPLFELDVKLPADWTVLSAQRDEKSLKWQILSLEPGVNQLRILLDPPLAAETSGTIRLSLRRDVEGWPVEASPIVVALPELFLPQSSLSEVAFVIRGDDDLDLTAMDLTGLDPMPLKADFERLRFQSQDTRYSGELKVTRKPSRISAQTITFGRLDPQTLHVFIQAMAEIQGGGVRTLKIALPESAGTSLRFQSPVRQIVEQKPGPAQNGERVWTLQFDQRVRGVLPLFCDLELPRGNLAEFPIPQARFVNAERQSGYIAAEAGGEQRLTIEAKAADGSPLSEVDPLDVPDVYYVPKERVVAVYRSVTTGSTVVFKEERFDKLAVPTAVCPMLDVTTIMGRTGELQHQARFQLNVVGVQGLRVILPANTSLWATLVDGQPVEVRRQGDIYLVPLKPGVATPLLQLFYHSKSSDLSQFGTLEQPPPELSAQTGQGDAQPVEVLDQRWHLYYPASTLLVSSEGPLEPEQKLDKISLLKRLNSETRIPTLKELGWQLFAVIVTIGIIAFFVLAYRRGISIPLATIVATLVVGVLLIALLLPATQQAREAAHRAYSKRAPMATSATPAPAARYNVQNSDLSDQPMPKEPMAPAMPPAAAPAMPTDESLAMPQVESKSESMPARNDKNGNGIMMNDPFQAADGVIARVQEAPPANADQRGVINAPQAAQPGLPALARTKEKMALLSLAIDLPAPEGSSLKTFRYTGTDSAQNGIALKLGYVDEKSGSVLRVFVIVMMAFIGWFLRNSRCTTKVALAALGLTLPLALLPLAPEGLHLILDGAFFGAIIVCVLWLIVGLGRCVHCCGIAWNAPIKISDRRGMTIGMWMAIVILQLATTASAQPTQQPAQPNAQPSAPVRAEVKLIVPYEGGIDPQTPERILLPMDKFLELYRQAYPDKPLSGPAPHAGGVVEALYSAKLSPNEKTPDDSTVDVTARFAIRSYVDGQLQVELPLGAVAARSAKLDGKNAPLIVNGACSKVAIPTAGLHVVDFEFSIPARLSGSTGTFTLPLTAVPSGKLSFALPAKDLAVRINGSSTVFRRVTQKDAQTIEVPVDKGGDLAISWQPEQAKGAAAAVVHVDSVQAITLTDAGTRVSTGFQYRIRQGSVADVTFSLPSTFRLQSVTGPDVGGWELQGEGDTRKLRVIFRRNISDATQLTIEAFLNTNVGTESTVITIPQLAPFEVTNEIGQVAVFAGDQFTLRADKVESLSQIDSDKFATTIPVSKPKVSPQLAYRFSKRPFSLNLRASRQESQANVVAQQAAFVTRRKQQLTTRLTYNLTGSPRSSFNIKLPAGYVILDLKATGLHDWSTGTQNDQTTLTIDLNGPRLGLAEVVLSGFVPRESDANASIEFPQPLDATKLNSTVAVWLDEGFTATLDSFTGWRSVDEALVNSELKAIRPNSPVQFAFTTQQATPGEIKLNLHRATPRLTANGLAMVTVTDVGVVHTLALQWHIDSATTDSLVFTTPNFLAGKLEFTGSGIRETTHTDAGNGRTRWTIWLRTPISGQYFVAAVATLPPATTEVVAPSIVFERAGTPPAGAAANGLAMAVDGQRQYVLLINSSQSQLTSATPELTESVQREDVPVVVDQKLVDQATELVKVKQLLTAPKWTLQKFSLTASAPASVNVADIATILSRDGTYRGEAVYTIKNHSRQFLALKLPADAKLLSVFVGNMPSRAVTTKRNGQSVELIALPKTSAASLSFPVRIVWRGSLGVELPKSVRIRQQLLDIPAPVVIGQQDPDFGADFGIPVAKTRWTVWLPEDLDVRPLKDAARHNLNLQESDQRDLLYEKAAVQELSELLGFVEQNYSAGSNKAQASNNMKQIGMALSNAYQLQQAVQGVDDSKDYEFSRQKGLAMKRLSEVQKKFVQEQQVQQQQALQQQQQLQQPIVGGGGTALNIENSGNMLFGNSTGGIQLQLDSQQIANNTIDNNRTLFLSNANTAGTKVQAGDDVTKFNFELQTKDAEVANEKPAQAKGGKGTNLDTRQQLRSGNDVNVDSLNQAITRGKAAGQQGQQGQGGFGGGQFGQQGQNQLPAQSYSQIGGFVPTQQGLGFGGPVGQNQQGGQGGFGGGQFGGNMWNANPNNPGGGQGGFGGGQFGGAEFGRQLGGAGGANSLTPQPTTGLPSYDNSGLPLQTFGAIQLPGQPRSNDRLRGLYGYFDGTANTPNGPAGGNRNGGLGMEFDPPADRREQFGEDRRHVMDHEAEGLHDFAQRDLHAGVPANQRRTSGSAGWTQSGGLSLMFNLPTSGKKLVFSKAGGDPKLALAIRPQESIRWGLNLVWTIVWVAIGLGIVLAVRSTSVSAQLTRQLPIAIAALSVLGFVLLPNPLNICSFVTFVIMSLIVAWIHRNEPKPAT